MILNVDGNDSVRHTRSRLLREAGYEVVEAANAAEALQMAAGTMPHLIIAEVNLPDMDGAEMCRRLKKEPRAIVTLIMDTRGSSGDRASVQRRLEESADGYLVAPVEPAVLLASVRCLLRLSAAEESLRVNSLEITRLQELAEHARVKAEQARNDADMASRTRDEFLSTVSHELRAPLNALLTWTHLLRGGTLDERAAARALEGIERSSRLQTQLIDDLLDVSRIISRKLRLGLRPVDTASVIGAAVDAARQSAEAKGIHLESHLDRSVGSIYGDPGRLQQIAANLLSNAVKFTPEDGRITVELTRSGTYAQLVVSDTGEGIDAELLPQIFEPFRQADVSTTRRHGGLGLGLAIVRHLVELHGGSVAASSPGPGQGAVFTVALPLISARLESAAADADTALPPANLAGVHVLVVDDELETRESVTAMLQRYGARVTAVGNVADALGALRGGTPDVLLSDIGMPEEDGYSLIRKVRALTLERGGRIPAVALTAYANAGALSSARAAGFEFHITKPIDPPRLVALIARIAKNESQPRTA